MPADDWLKFPEGCWATVTTGPRSAKEHQACEKTAVAVAIYDDGEYSAYPVCKHHSRGRQMLPLSELIRLAKEQQ